MLLISTRLILIADEPVLLLHLNRIQIDVNLVLVLVLGGLRNLYVNTLVEGCADEL